MKDPYNHETADKYNDLQRALENVKEGAENDQKMMKKKEEEDVEMKGGEEEEKKD